MKTTVDSGCKLTKHKKYRLDTFLGDEWKFELLQKVLDSQTLSAAEQPGQVMCD